MYEPGRAPWCDRRSATIGQRCRRTPDGGIRLRSRWRLRTSIEPARRFRLLRSNDGWVGRDLPEQRTVALPRLEQIARAPAARAGGVLLDELPKSRIVFVVEIEHSDHVAVDTSREDLRLVQDVRGAIGHSSGEVPAHGPQHHDRSGGHVLAAVVARALDDGDSPRVADGEPIAGAAGREERARGGAVERGVAENDLRVSVIGGRCFPERPDHEVTARQALPDVVVRFTLELEAHAGHGKRPEALARAATEPQANPLRGELLASAPGKVARDAGADGQVVVPDVVDAGEWTTTLEPRAECAEDFLVQALDIRTVVALRDTASGSRAVRERVGQEQRQIEHLRPGHLGAVHSLQQVGASDDLVHGPAAQLREDVADVFRDPREVADHLFRGAAELRAQLRTLGRDSRGTGIQVALARHVAPEGDERGGAE